jgi:hypothetical protein
VRVDLLAVLLIACGSPRPSGPPAWTPPEPIDESWRPAPLVGIQPLPTELALLDVDPDPVDWRWPLPHPPQLLPSGELSAMFGTTAEWATLCAARRDPRGVDRDEALAYLRAWCDATPDLALAKALLPLVRARTSEIAAAATLDLAAVLESQLAAKEALAWLRFHGAHHDFVLDALAASYLTTDRLDDTRFVVKALQAYRAHPTLACRRMFRELFVAERSRRDAIRLSLSLSNDAVCSRLSAHASCTLSWGNQAHGDGSAPARLDLDRCTPLLLDRPELLPHAYLTIAAAHWPATSRSFDGWLAYAMFTTGAAGAPRADELIAAAFTNAVRLSNCAEQLDLVLDVVAHSTLPRVRELRTLTPAECRRQQGSPPP